MSVNSLCRWRFEEGEEFDTIFFWCPIYSSDVKEQDMLNSVKEVFLFFVVLKCSVAIIPFFSEPPFTRRLTKQLLTRILTGPSLVIEYCQEQSHSLWREISFPDNLSMRSKYIRQTLRAKFAGHPGREEAVFRTLWNFQAPSIIYPESTLFLSPSFLLKHLKAISDRVRRCHPRFSAIRRGFWKGRKPRHQGTSKKERK